MSFNPTDKDRTFTQEEVNQMISDRLQRERNTLEAYKAEQAAKEAAAVARQQLLGRMAACIGNDQVLVHERLRDLIADDFDAALKDPANKGKTDMEVFKAITKDQGYLEPKNKPKFTGPANARFPDNIHEAFFGKKG